jgi:hypothetical protein
MCLSIFLFLSELGTCPQNLIPTRGVEHWEKINFPQKGMMKFTYKGRFLTIKIAYEKFLDWKSKQWKHALVPLLHVEFFFLENTKLSIFGRISKFHLWADFSSFGQFWADFAALTMADSMPQLGLKSLKPHNFWTISPNDTCSISLESYNPYLQPQKVSKNPKI